MVDRPTGSVATINSPLSASSFFTPDVAGSYLVELTVDEGRSGQVDRRIAAVQETVGSSQVRWPAAGEGDEANWNIGGTPNTRGWLPSLEDAVRAALAEPASSGTAVPYIVREVDLTAESAQDFFAGGDGDYVINGTTWHVANTANVGTSFGVVPGVGVRQVDTTSSGFAYTHNTQTAPYLRTELGALIPDYDPFGVYAIDVHLTASGDDDEEQVKLSLHGEAGTPGTSVARHFSIARGVMTGGGYVNVEEDSTIHRVAAADTPDGASTNVISVRWDGSGLNFGSRFGQYSGDWPNPSAMTPGPSFSESGTLSRNILNHPDVFIALSWPAPSGAGANNAGDVHRIRVWRLG
jgi:hypothetical protein